MENRCSNCYELTSADASIFKCPNCGSVGICASSAQNMPHESLKGIVYVYGEQILSEKQRMNGLLSDMQLREKAIKLIMLAIDADIHTKLLNNAKEADSIKCAFVVDNSGLCDKEIAGYIVDSFSYSLGLIQSIDHYDLTKIKDWFWSFDKPVFSTGDVRVAYR